MSGQLLISHPKYVQSALINGSSDLQIRNGYKIL